MSLSDDQRHPTTKILLRSADQYELWKARITALCWASSLAIAEIK